MILPPANEPPPGSGSPAAPAAAAGDAWDGDAVLAGLDPDIAGLDPDALADRPEPAEAELYGLDPGPGDDADPGDWIAGIAVAGPGEAFAEGGPLQGADARRCAGGAVRRCPGRRSRRAV